MICGGCDRVLRSEKSKALGYGPKCAKRLGMKAPRKLAATETDPNQMTLNIEPVDDEYHRNYYND